MAGLGRALLRVWGAGESVPRRFADELVAGDVSSARMLVDTGNGRISNVRPGSGLSDEAADMLRQGVSVRNADVDPAVVRQIEAARHQANAGRVQGLIERLERKIDPSVTPEVANKVHGDYRAQLEALDPQLVKALADKEASLRVVGPGKNVTDGQTFMYLKGQDAPNNIGKWDDAGGAACDGHVCLCFDNLARGGRGDVFHEVSHLVQERLPPNLQARMKEVFQNTPRERIVTGLGSMGEYAANNEREFMSVASEAFFGKARSGGITPRQLQERFPEMHALLRDIYPNVDEAAAVSNARRLTIGDQSAAWSRRNAQRQIDGEIDGIIERGETRLQQQRRQAFDSQQASRPRAAPALAPTASALDVPTPGAALRDFERSHLAGVARRGDAVYDHGSDTFFPRQASSDGMSPVDQSAWDGLVIKGKATYDPNTRLYSADQRTVTAVNARAAAPQSGARAVFDNARAELSYHAGIIKDRLTPRSTQSQVDDLFERVNKASAESPQNFEGSFRRQTVCLQEGGTCGLHALYNNDKLLPVRQAMDFGTFHDVAENSLGRPIGRNGVKGLDPPDYKTILGKLGYAVEDGGRVPLKSLGRESSENLIGQKLRAGQGGVPASLRFGTDRSHAVVIRGRFLEDGRWNYIVEDSNFKAPQVYTADQLLSHGVEVWDFRPAAGVQDVARRADALKGAVSAPPAAAARPVQVLRAPDVQKGPTSPKPTPEQLAELVGENYGKLDSPLFAAKLKAGPAHLLLDADGNVLTVFNSERELSTALAAGLAGGRYTRVPIHVDQRSGRLVADVSAASGPVGDNAHALTDAVASLNDARRMQVIKSAEKKYHRRAAAAVPAREQAAVRARVNAAIEAETKAGEAPGARYAGSSRVELLEKQCTGDCYVRAHANNPGVVLPRDGQTRVDKGDGYQALLAKVNARQDTPISSKQSGAEGMDKLLAEAGYRRSRPENLNSMLPGEATAAIVSKLRQGKTVHAEFTLSANWHAVLIQEAFKEGDGWKFVIVDSKGSLMNK